MIIGKKLIVPVYNGRDELTLFVWIVFIFQWCYQEVGRK